MSRYHLGIQHQEMTEYLAPKQCFAYSLLSFGLQSYHNSGGFNVS